MATTTPPLERTYTLEEFWALPDPPDGTKLELIDGILHMSPPPTEDHDDSFSRTIMLLAGHIAFLGLKGKLYSARAAVWKTPATHLEPDLLYVTPEFRAQMGKNRTSADLVIEILSPSTSRYDRTKKAVAYGSLGVKELWLLDERSRTVEVRVQTGQGFGEGRLFGADELLVSTVFPQLEVRPRQFFED